MAIERTRKPPGHHESRDFLRTDGHEWAPVVDHAHISRRAATVPTARDLWGPAVSNARTWGRRAFIEVTDPWDAKNAVRSFMAGRRAEP